MALTPKLATSTRVYTDGDGTLGSGFGKTQNRKGQGNLDPGFINGGVTQKSIYSCVWDDSLDGHIPAGGSLGLGVTLPVGFVVTSVYFDVEVLIVGPTNVFVSLNDDADLVASAGIGVAPWAPVGIKHGSQVDAGAVNAALTVQGPIVATTAKEIAIGGTGAASSAGRVAIFIEGFVRPAAVTQGAAA